MISKESRCYTTLCIIRVQIEESEESSLVKFLFSLFASWAFPVIRKIFSYCFRLYVVLRISFFRITDPSAFCAPVFASPTGSTVYPLKSHPFFYYKPV